MDNALWTKSFRVRTLTVKAIPLMKRPILILVLILSVAIAIVRLEASPPTPTVGTLAATPSTIIVAAPTQVLFTISISDPTVLPTGVTLVQTDSSGRTLATVASMRDDGLLGDLSAGDRTFSYRLMITQSTPTDRFFRVSVAFKGTIQRVVSNVVTLAGKDLASIIGSSVSGTIGTTGGVISDNSQLLTMTVPAGALAEGFTFTVHSVPRDGLPDTVAPTLPLYGAVEIRAVASSPDSGVSSAETFSADIRMPLQHPSVPGQFLDVLETTRSAAFWRSSGIKALVLPDGISATFTTRAIGLFLLADLQ